MLLRNLELFRLSKSLEALDAARALGITTAVNLIADPDWQEPHFRAVRDWALSVPEFVSISVNTPYPGTETFLTDSRRLTTLDRSPERSGAEVK